MNAQVPVVTESDPAVIETRSETDAVAAAAQEYATIGSLVVYEEAADFLKRLKSALRSLEERRRALTRPIDEAKRQALALFKPSEAKLERAELIVKRAMVAYQDEQERIRREQQRKLEEQARAEAARLAEQARRAADAGREKRAAELQQRATTVVAPVIAPAAAPKVSGIQTREIWRFRIVDRTKIPREYLIEDEKKIRRVVEALKQDAKIDGVEVYSEKSIAASGV